MLHILRKYNKKILAVVGVFLMVSFVADLGFRRYSRMPGETISPGKIGETKLSPTDFRYAVIEWQMLRGREMILGMFPVMELQLAARLAPAFASPDRNQSIQQALSAASQILRQIEPLDFLLLLKEAQRMNVRVSPDAVRQVLEQIEQNDRSAPDNPALREKALADWMTVLEAFDRISASAKASQAMSVHLVAQSEQQVALKLVEFKAADFKSQVQLPAAPSTQQTQPATQQATSPIQEFFEKYRDVDPETSESGFGYRYPHRIKLEYVKIPLAKIKETITDEDTYAFWKHNQEQFPTTQPAATMPATLTAGPETMPASRPLASASTQPTTRPWAEVKDQIRDRLAMEHANRITKTALQTLNGDWAFYKQGAATGAGSQVVTSLDAPFNTYLYLQRLQTHIQSLKDARKVLPELASEGELLGRRELANLPGIGKAYLLTTERRPIAFADFALERATAFMTDAQHKREKENQVPLLAPHQPSLPLRDLDGNYYIFRITAADPAHPAASIEPLEKKVREDWITAQAYEKAKEQARKFIESARNTGLQAATQPAGNLPIIDTGLFTNNARDPIAQYTLAEQVRPKFVQEAFSLLRQRLKTGQLHPMTVIDLPTLAMSVVAVLDDAKPAVEHIYFPLRAAGMQRVLEGRQTLNMAAGWFSPQAIEKRMDFKPSESSGLPRREQPSAPPPPLF